MWGTSGRWSDWVAPGIKTGPTAQPVDGQQRDSGALSTERPRAATSLTYPRDLLDLRNGVEPRFLSAAEVDARLEAEQRERAAEQAKASTNARRFQSAPNYERVRAASEAAVADVERAEAAAAVTHEGAA